MKIYMFISIRPRLRITWITEQFYEHLGQKLRIEQRDGLALVDTPDYSLSIGDRISDWPWVWWIARNDAPHLQWTSTENVRKLVFE
eukprot:COSAG02_NODE_5803_length_4024_cov_60.505700_3_plen_86_part_00